MRAYFYDIESLSNVFTLCNFIPHENKIDIYYLVDDLSLVSDPDFENALLTRIHEKNKNFTGSIELFNLLSRPANEHLARAFGLSDSYLVNDPNAPSSYDPSFRPVCDTDPDYSDDNHPYIMGYNSYNYDTTMLAMYLYEVFPLNYDYAPNGGGEIVSTMGFKPTTAKLMRSYNDDLFLPRFKENMPTRLLQTYDPASHAWSQSDYSDTRHKIRKSMMMTGRHLDVARLNEKQSKVGLKRLLGMLGYQILESDKLGHDQSTIENMDQLLDLIAYNVSDVVNLEKLFYDQNYKSAFDLKKRLLKTYPELVYDRIKGKYEPDKRPFRVRRDRLMIDSSSAQLATKCLCPYDHLTDIPCVSFMYPSEKKSKELGIPRVNVLEESKKFFYNLFPQPEIRARFDLVYNYYKSIEGKNFNESKSFMEDWGSSPEYQKPISLNDIPKADCNLVYYYADGTPSSCFAGFSTGGVHGAEYNQLLYLADIREFENNLADLNHVKSQYPDPIDCKKAKKIQMPDGREVPATKFLKSGSTLKKSFYKELDAKRPRLFVPTDDGATKLNPRYTFTSTDPTTHEDFCSYYPSLLMMMSAFWNDGLGYDRYAEIFEDKQRYGKLKKDKSLTPEKREEYGILQAGTKLILNSASGAADAGFESNIRMNNNIISMRIIGQLFSWRIGQALAYAGARIVSTNTDGLYSVLESELNNRILAHEAETINVQIDPEPMYLISKDTNNRIEMDPDTGKIAGASGGSLACRKGPNVTKSLTHPAAIDWALTEYLIVAALRYKNLSVNAAFDDTVGMNILKSMKDKFEPVHLLRMFQNVIASSVGSINYVFGTTDNNPGTPIILQHYNRVFIMKDGTPDTMHLHSANARVITAAQQQKRRKDNERAQQHDSLAVQVLAANGVTLRSLPSTKEAVVKKVTNIEDAWYMFVCNKDLHYLPQEEIDFILDNLDYDKYLQLLRDSFENNWRNQMPKDYVDPVAEPVEAENSTDATVTAPAEPATESNPETNCSNGMSESAKQADEDNFVDNTINSDETVVTEITTASSGTTTDETINGTKGQSTEQYSEQNDDIISSNCSDTELTTDASAVVESEIPKEPTVTDTTLSEQPAEPVKPDSSTPNIDKLDIMSLLDDADIQRIMDTSKFALTSLDNKRAVFTFATEDPEIVARLCKLLY